jgi:hypothetical protein
MKWKSIWHLKVAPEFADKKFFDIFFEIFFEIFFSPTTHNDNAY